MTSNLESLKRHLAKPIPITFKNAAGEEDTFMFKPFNIEQQAVFMEISKKIEGRKKIMINGIESPDVSKDDIVEVSTLFEDVVMNSLKSQIEGIDDETVKEFVNSNFEVLFEKMELLIPKTQSSNALALIKQRKEAVQSGGTGSQENTG